MITRLIISIAIVAILTLLLHLAGCAMSGIPKRDWLVINSFRAEQGLEKGKKTR